MKVSNEQINDGRLKLMFHVLLHNLIPCGDTDTYCIRGANKGERNVFWLLQHSSTLGKVGGGGGVPVCSRHFLDTRKYGAQQNATPLITCRTRNNKNWPLKPLRNKMVLYVHFLQIASRTCSCWKPSCR